MLVITLIAFKTFVLQYFFPLPAMILTTAITGGKLAADSQINNEARW